MKKFFATGLAAALIAGMVSFAQAKPVSEMDVDITGLAQISAEWGELDANLQADQDDDIDTARLRLNVGAMPAENVSFNGELEITDNQQGGDNRIVEAYVDLTYLDWMTARIGQFALPNSYELNTPEYELETIDYSLGFAAHNANGSNYFSGRDRGIMLFGDPIPEFGWNVLVINGSGATEGANDDTDDQMMYGLQLDWNPVIDMDGHNLSFKLWGIMQQDGISDTTGTATPDIDIFGLGLNYTYAGFHLFGEYNMADMDTAAAKNEADEWYLNASYKIPETDLQLVLRYDALETETNNATTLDQDEITVGMNWDFEKNARLQMMYTINDYNTVGVDEPNQFDMLLSVRF